MPGQVRRHCVLPPGAGRGCGMNRLHQAAADYIGIRQVLGFEHHGSAVCPVLPPTRRTPLAWASAPASTSPDWHRARLSVVRGFASHLAALDPQSRVPRPGYPAALSGPLPTCLACPLPPVEAATRYLLR